MNRVVRLRLRATCILRNQAIHQIENDFLRNEWVSIDFCKAFRSKPRAMREPTPVIDVWNCHVVHATGDSIGLTDTHYRDVDDLSNFSRNDLRKVAYVAGVLSIRENFHFSYATDVVEVAPNQFANQRRRQYGFGIISVARRSCLELVTINSRPITGSFDST